VTGVGQAGHGDDPARCDVEIGRFEAWAAKAGHVQARPPVLADTASAGRLWWEVSDDHHDECGWIGVDAWLVAWAKARSSSRRYSATVAGLSAWPPACRPTKLLNRPGTAAPG
jgi:hypothetical protein